MIVRKHQKRPLVVVDIMQWPALQVGPKCTCDEAYALMRENQVSHLVVGLGALPLGVVCETDAAAAPHAMVADIAQRTPVVSPLDPVGVAASMLWELDVCAVPARVPGRACGLVTRQDLVRWRITSAAPRCEACGSHHRVRTGVGFCAACLARTGPLGLDEIEVALEAV